MTGIQKTIFIPQVLRATLIMPKEPLSGLFRVQVGMFHISCFIASFFLMVLPFHLVSHCISNSCLSNDTNEQFSFLW